MKFAKIKARKGQHPAHAKIIEDEFNRMLSENPVFDREFMDRMDKNMAKLTKEILYGT